MLFEGDRIGTEAFLKTHAGRFYVYLLCRPNGSPFYVGKGSNRRVFVHEAEALRNHPIGESNPFKCNVIRNVVREGGRSATRSIRCTSLMRRCVAWSVRRRSSEGIAGFTRAAS